MKYHITINKCICGLIIINSKRLKVSFTVITFV